MKAEIRECPHCGGEATIKIIQTPFPHGWVGCPVCKIYKQWQHSPKEAVEIWNRTIWNGIHCRDCMFYMRDDDQEKFGWCGNTGGGGLDGKRVWDNFSAPVGGKTKMSEYNKQWNHSPKEAIELWNRREGNG